MKILGILSLCFMCAGLSSAQDSVAEHPPHGLLILKLEWTREPTPLDRYRSTFPEGSGGLRSDPDGTAHAPSSVEGRPIRDQGKPLYLYVYSMRVKNVGAKTILAVFWEYVTNDTFSGRELGRRQIINYEKIKPDGGATLKSKHPSPPANIVAADASKASERPTLAEHAEIKCVLYTDGTVWKDSAATGTECEELRRIDREVKMQERGRH
ncbi:MAG: hypothetical protein QOH51_3523 [Acidobacteriota bacterium]|jgi:hypothetical protein|nr:hypothetical protein [Acidobacteriota bacterium]